MVEEAAASVASDAVLLGSPGLAVVAALVAMVAVLAVVAGLVGSLVVAVDEISAPSVTGWLR